VKLADPADRKNRVTVEYFDRTQKYRITPVTQTDEAAVAMYGLRPEESLGWRIFADGSAASQAAQIRLQREQATLATYEFNLPWRFLQLEPGDLLSLRDPVTMAVAAIVKVLELSEGSDDSIDVVAEDFPIGHANAPLYAPQLASGWNPNHNVASGDVTLPMFFEPPGSSVGGTGLEVWIAATSSDPNWGGADVYASLDNGATYKLVSRIDQAARMGALQTALAAGTGASLDVLLAGRGGKLQSTSAYDADALSTLSYLGDTDTGEWLAYQTSALTATNRYTLTGLRRGRYGSTDRAFPVGARFAFIDSAIVRSGPLPLTMVGQVIKFKFCSYNLFGAALQSLAVAPEYSYKVTGRFMNQTGKPISANLLSNAMLDCSPGPKDFAAAGGGLEYFGTDGFIHTLNDTDANRLLKIKGLPTNVMIWQGGEVAEFSYGRWVQPMPCDATKRYVAFIGMINHRAVTTATRAHLQFFDADGVQITSRAGDYGTQIASNETRNPANPAEYTDSFLFVYPPTNAKSMRLVPIKDQTITGRGNSALFITKPFVGVALPEQTELPVWEAGGQNLVATQSIQPGASFELPPSFKNPGPVSLPYNVETVLLQTTTLGPWPVDTRVIVTATGVLVGGIQVGGQAAEPPKARLSALVSGQPQFASQWNQSAAPMDAPAREYRHNLNIVEMFEVAAGSTLMVWLSGVQTHFGFSTQVASDLKIITEVSKLR
jgi:hypothetical protein